MEPSQSDPALSDPLFAELRRRHPDVDVVLLPEFAPVPPDLPEATEGQLNALTRHVEAVLAALGARVEVTPEISLRFWHEQRNPLVRRWTVKSLLPVAPTEEPVDLDAVADPGAPEVPPASVDLLKSVGDALLALGWDARASVEAPPRIRALAGPVELVATAVPAGVGVVAATTPQYAAPEAFEAALEAVAS